MKTKQNNNHNNNYTWKELASVAFVLVPSGQVVDIAFMREALWESLSVFAVIIDHVIILNPFHLTLACKIKVLPEPWVADGVREGRIWTARRCSIIPNTSIDTKVSIGSNEGCLCPINLDKSTSCCPVISIPKTRVNPHLLVLREWNTNSFQVLEFSNWNAIYIETNMTKYSS